MQKELVNFVKDCRKLPGLTQKEFAEKAGVGLRFISDLEQGKETLRMVRLLVTWKLEIAPQVSSSWRDRNFQLPKELEVSALNGFTLGFGPKNC
jgi:transcriptional regulator with XRE-family HTH domain